MNVSICLASEPQPAMVAALKQAGHVVQFFAAEGVALIAALNPAPHLLIVDGEALVGADTGATVAQLSQRMPVALVTAAAAPMPAALPVGLHAVALLPRPVETASLLASLPLWLAQHSESTARRLAESELLAALQSSRRISSAVGMLAERYGIPLDDAFSRLRREARAKRMRIEEWAQSIEFSKDDSRSAKPRADEAPEPEVTPNLLAELQALEVELAQQNQELQRAQQVLARSRARFLALYDLAPVGYCTLNGSGVIQHANGMLARLLATPRTALEGAHLSQYILPSDRHLFDLGRLQAQAAQASKAEHRDERRADDPAAESIQSIAAVPSEMRMLRPDGALIWVQWATADIEATGEQPLPEQPVLLIALTEISSRKRAEAELRASEQFAIAVADNVPGMLGYWNRQLRCQFANHHYLEWFGRNAQEMKGIRIQDLKGEALFAQNEPFIRAALAGVPQQFERQIVKADGKPGHTWAQYVPHRVDGEVQGFFALVTDITVLKASMARQRVKAAALKAVSQGVLITGPDRCVLSANDAFLANSGYTEAELLGLKDGFMHGPDTDPTVVGRIREALSKRTEFAGEILNYRKDGSTFWNELTISPVFDEDGALSNFIGVARDITERKRAQDALAHSADMLDRTGELAGVGGWELDLQTRKLSWTLQTFRIAEIEPPVPPALDAGIDLFAPEARPVIAAAVQAAIDTGTPYDLELPLITAKGRRRWVRTQGFAELHDGKPSRIFGTFQDITKNRELARELDRHRHHLEDLVAERTAAASTALEQADAANRAKSAFLANMSHEVRTPLNAILGQNYLLRRDGVTPEQAMRLDKIDSAGQHLLSVVNDVLDLSKIEAGRVQIESTTFHLSAVLDAVQSMIADSARAKGLAVKVGGDAVPLWLRGDPTRLRQALLNFAGNAVKFTERGSVTLAAKLLQDRGDELLVRFSVTDTGIGIAAENLPRLFQSFEQADASITRKFGGTGLGLAITRRLAELMHGECGVDSEAGHGSSFWFTALFQRGHSVSPVAAIESPTMLEEELRRNHRGARVLLAEDNEVNREIAVSMLDGVGLAVDVAVDGQQAVTMAGSRRYALVLMDMQMPRMGGLEATRVIRSLEGWESRPILALTASAFAEDRLACKAAGMNDLIAKPMDVKVLYSALLKWLDGPGARAA